MVGKNSKEPIIEKNAKKYPYILASNVWIYSLLKIEFLKKWKNRIKRHR